MADDALETKDVALLERMDSRDNRYEFRWKIMPTQDAEFCVAQYGSTPWQPLSTHYIVFQRIIVYRWLVFSSIMLVLLVGMIIYLKYLFIQSCTVMLFA